MTCQEALMDRRSKIQSHYEPDLKRQMQRDLAEREGIFAVPTSAAASAGLEILTNSGVAH